MSKLLSALLEELLLSVRAIMAYTDGVSKEGFLASMQLQDAVVRRLEIIGEGVKGLPQDWCDMHPEVPWRQIARMRDTLIHRYFSVDLEVVWQTVTVDIPVLEPQLAALIAGTREQESGSQDDSAT